MNVVIVGAGLAGPLLAQGLLRAGIDVAVYERAPADQPGQGYRIHIAPDGDAALRSCLPPARYEEVRATSGKPGSGWRLLDPELNVIQETLVDSAIDHLTVDRLTLRRILLTGIDVRYDAGFQRYSTRGDRVHVTLADGTVHEADLLVGADGTYSRVRTQLLPDAEVVDLGHPQIYGTTPLTDEVRTLVPVALDGFCAAVGPDGRTASLAAHEFRSGGSDYVMWVIGAPVDRFPTGSSTLDGTALRAIAADLIADWHPAIGALVRHGDPATVHTTAVRTSNPVPHWAPTPVTLVGDAIHPMVPQGTSAAVALRDAGLLCRRIVERTGPLLDAVREYESEMLAYGFAEVERALRISPWNPASPH